MPSRRELVHFRLGRILRYTKEALEEGGLAQCRSSFRDALYQNNAAGAGSGKYSSDLQRRRFLGICRERDRIIGISRTIFLESVIGSRVRLKPIKASLHRSKTCTPAIRRPTNEKPMRKPTKERTNKNAEVIAMMKRAKGVTFPL